MDNIYTRSKLDQINYSKLGSPWIYKIYNAFIWNKNIKYAYEKVLLRGKLSMASAMDDGETSDITWRECQLPHDSHGK